MKRITKIKFTTLESSTVGIIASIITTIASVSIGAMLIEKEYIEFDKIGIYIFAGQFLSVFIGSFAAGRIVNSNKLLSVVIVSVVYMTILLCIALLLFDGITFVFLTGVVASAVACLATILLLIHNKTHYKRRRRVGAISLK